MKRPQFSLRLLFLVITLIGGLAGWYVVIRNKQRADRDYQIMVLRSELSVEREAVMGIERAMTDPNLSKEHYDRLERSAKFIRGEMEEVERQIDAIDR